MTAAIRNASGVKAIADISVRDNAGALQGGQEAWIRTADGLKQFFSLFSVSTDKTGVAIKINSAGAFTATTRGITAVVEGAVGTVTYLWTQTGGDAGITIDSPTHGTTTFSATVGPDEGAIATFKCAVADASGHAADTADVTVRIINIYGFGGTA